MRYPQSFCSLPYFHALAVSGRTAENRHVRRNCKPPWTEFTRVLPAQRSFLYRLRSTGRARLALARAWTLRPIILRLSSGRAGLEPGVGDSYFQNASMLVEETNFSNFELKLIGRRSRVYGRRRRTRCSMLRLRWI